MGNRSKTGSAGKQIDLDAVQTWYDDRGKGEPLVLLHGGFTDSRDFTGNLDQLASRFRCLFPERRGHGHTPDVEGPISIEIMAADMIQFIERVVGRPVPVIGYSAGAMVALWIAVRRPDLITQLVLVSGAFDGDGLIFKPIAGKPMPAPLVAAYAEVSPDGEDHFKVVQEKIARAAAEEAGLKPDELKRVSCPALVIAADDDIVRLEHTVALFRGLPDAQLAVVPGTSHLLLHEKPAMCLGLALDFLTQAPAETLMPIHRTPNQRPQST